MTDQKEYISVADTAKLVRAHLKQKFPGVKFSVRSKSYSGGASIDIGWTDGPCSARVDKVAKQYEGASFDGSIDLKSHHDSILMGTDGTPRKVHFGSDYVFTHRENSSEAARTAVITELLYTRCGGIDHHTPGQRTPTHDRWGNTWISDYVTQCLYGRDFEKESEEQAFERITMSRGELE